MGCRWDRVLPTSWQILAVIVIFLVLGLTLHAEACLYLMIASLEGYPNSWARVLPPNPGHWCVPEMEVKGCGSWVQGFKGYRRHLWGL